MDDDIALALDSAQAQQGAHTQGILARIDWHMPLLLVVFWLALFCFSPLAFGPTGAQGPPMAAGQTTLHLGPVAPEPLVQCTPEYVRLSKSPLVRPVRNTAPQGQELLPALPVLPTVLPLPVARFTASPFRAAHQSYGHRGPIYFSLPPPVVYS